MSAAQAVFSGWMEIADKAVDDQARQHEEEVALAGLVSQYSGTLYRVAYSVVRNAADAEAESEAEPCRSVSRLPLLHPMFLARP